MLVDVNKYRTACMQDNTKQCRQKSIENKFNIAQLKKVQGIVYEECATLPSERAWSTTASLMMGLAGRLTEREPWRHIMAERSSE